MGINDEFNDLDFEDIQAAADFYDRTMSQEINMTIEEILHAELDKQLNVLKGADVPLEYLNLQLQSTFMIEENAYAEVTVSSEILEDMAHNYYLEDRLMSKDIYNYDNDTVKINVYRRDVC